MLVSEDKDLIKQKKYYIRNTRQRIRSLKNSLYQE